MSFNVIIKGVPDRELGPLLARMSLPKSVSVEPQHVPDEQTAVAKKPNNAAKARNRHTKLHMTGKKPRNSERIATCLDIFERLEADKGIGTVSIEMFREQLTKDKEDVKMVGRLVSEGYLEYLD